ncbi:MAG: hypothetical protein O2809_11350 [Proteobacteria bacterium]|nr:hypothetical protein [Pseudomonadota bacterium]
MSPQRAFLLNCIRHPSILYFCILPVYVPIRALAESISSFNQVFKDDFERLYFFSDMLIIGAILGLITWLTVMLTEKLIKDVKQKSDALTMVGFFCPFLLMLTTYILLSGKFGGGALYMTMGVHFFLLSYLGNQVILHTKRYQLVAENSLSNEIKNNLMSFIVNTLGIIVTILFVGFSFLNLLLPFTLATSLCGAVFYYFRFVRGIESFNIQVFLKCLLSFGIGALLALLCGALMYHWHNIADALVIVIIAFLSIAIALKTKPRYVMLCINGASQYSIVVYVLMSSVLLFLFNDQLSQIYQAVYPLEPVFSLIVVIIGLRLILRKKSQTTDATIRQNIFLFGMLMLPLLWCFYAIGSANIAWVLLAVIVFFIIYAIVEYVVMFNLRQIIFTNQYSNQTNTLLSTYLNILYQGFIPVIYLSIASLLHRYSMMAFKDVLLSSLLILVLLVILFNFITQLTLRKC